VELVTAPGAPVDDAALAEVVDNRGMLCAQGILRLMRVLLHLSPGAVVKVLSTDPAAEHDYPAWCRNTGHAFLGHTLTTDERGGPLVLSYIRRKADDSG
jgi:tRNA 2-thiouridine synthesizing protein A